LTQLRRQQLHDLARAYGIEVTKDGTKDQILPALIDAEARGVFRGHAKKPYYLEKAMRNPDQTATPLHDPDMDVEPEPVVQEAGPALDPPKKVRKPSEFNLLQKQARELGINGWGMKKDHLKKAIEDEINRRRQTGN